jgi:inner membrane protein
MNTAYFWLVVGLVLMIAEVVTPGFILFFFGLSAVIVGLLSFIPFIAASGTWQLLLFAVLSVTTLLLLRRQMKALFTGRSRNGQHEINDAFVGHHAVVTERIAPPKDGKVEANGVSWSATAGEIIDAGTPVEVVSRQGLTLSVRPRVS